MTDLLKWYLRRRGYLVLTCADYGARLRLQRGRIRNHAFAAGVEAGYELATQKARLEGEIKVLARYSWN